MIVRKLKLWRLINWILNLKIWKLVIRKWKCVKLKMKMGKFENLNIWKSPAPSNLPTPTPAPDQGGDSHFPLSYCFRLVNWYLRINIHIIFGWSMASSIFILGIFCHYWLSWLPIIQSHVFTSCLFVFKRKYLEKSSPKAPYNYSARCGTSTFNSILRNARK